MNTAAPEVDIVNMALAMLAIIFLIFVMAWLLKRLTGVVGYQNNLIKIKSITSLGVKEKLVLIEVEGQHMLLGVTGQQITKLKDLELQEPIAEVKTSPFSQKLKSLLHKGSDQWQNSGTQEKD